MSGKTVNSAILLAGSLMIVVPLILIGLQQRRKAPARGFNPATAQNPTRGRDTALSGGKIRLTPECRE
ncbi:MAG TPA: hypothetical protein VFN01_04135 [Marinobacter sp.]|uniref:hypothetical protein n=1 Tax=Marinobacter sp. TaxID=50741 RepID=UPI002D7E5EC6|nr:hypothetical protein [Marinobacter sp.]HET8800353.1 hypothetical protein [Marinobacter sp.]